MCTDEISILYIYFLCRSSSKEGWTNFHISLLQGKLMIYSIMSNFWHKKVDIFIFLLKKVPSMNLFYQLHNFDNDVRGEYDKWTWCWEGDMMFCSMSGCTLSTPLYLKFGSFNLKTANVKKSENVTNLILYSINLEVL